MATVLYDRVKELCTATGTGDITLTGALNTSTDEYVDRYADQEVVPYCIVESAAAWEVGEGVFTVTGTLIARTAGGVISSSNADGLVSFGGGDKECFASLTSADIASLLNRLKNTETNIALLHFYRAIDNSLSVQNMVDGFVDEFEDTTGVLGSYTANYDATNDLFDTYQSNGDTYLEIVSDGSMGVASQETLPKGLFISPDGLTVFVIGTQVSGEISRYTLNTAWDINGGRTFEETTDISLDINSPTDLFFKPDGLKMYVTTTTQIAQFTLSVAWDTSSTLTLLNTITLGANRAGMFFKPDGLKMYLTDWAAGQIHQYTLTVAWDTNGGTSLDGSWTESALAGLAFSSDGLTLYLIHGVDRDIDQFTLGTAWDVTGTMTERASFDIGGIAFEGLFLGDADLKLYVITSDLDRVDQYNLPSVKGLRALLDGSLSVTGVNAQGVVYDPTGLKLYIAEATLDQIHQYDLTTPWDITSGVTSAGVRVISTWQTHPAGLAFSPDGLNLFVIGPTPAAITHFTLGVAWDVTSTFTMVSEYDAAGLGSGLSGLAIKPDGTKMYTIGSSSDQVKQHTLPAPWRINPSLEGSRAVAAGAALFLKPDGSKAYIVDSASNLIEQLALATPWDVTTGVTVDGTTSVGSQTTFPAGIWFSAGGLGLFIMDGVAHAIVKYTLTVAWDVTGGKSYVGRYDFTPSESAPRNIVISADGTVLYIMGSFGDDVTQLSLPAAWSVGKEKTGQHTVPTGNAAVRLSSDGFKMYSLDFGTDIVTQYALTTAWDIDTGVTTDGSYSVTGDQAFPTGLAFSTDGTKMYVSGQTGDTVTQYTLTTAWDVTGTVTHNIDYSVASEGLTHNGVFFSTDGTKMYTVEDDGNDVNQYTLTTAWDLAGTVTFNGVTSVSGQSGSPDDIAFSADGTQMYVLDAQFVNRYTLTTAWDITGTVTFNDLADITDFALTSRGVTFSADGTRMYTSSDALVTQWDLPVAWQPDAEPTVDGVKSVSAQTGTPYGLFLDPTGLHMFVTSTGPNVYVYSLSVAFDVTSTVTYEGEFNSLFAQTNLRSIFFNLGGSKMYLLSDVTLKQWDLPIAWEPHRTLTQDGVFSVNSEESGPQSISFDATGVKMYCIGTQFADPIQYKLSTPWDITGTVTFQGILDFFFVMGSGQGLSMAISGDGTKMLTGLPDTIYQSELLDPVQPMDIVSATQTALSQPDDALVLILEEDIDAITLNTDIIVSVSRDGGTTYTAGTLEQVGTSTAGLNMLVADVDLSSQPAGTSMVYKISGTKQKLKLHGVSLQWR